MENKEVYHEWSVIEYIDIIDCYDQEVLITDGEYIANGMMSCGEIVEIYEKELITENN